MTRFILSVTAASGATDSDTLAVGAGVLRDVTLVLDGPGDPTDVTARVEVVDSGETVHRPTNTNQPRNAVVGSDDPARVATQVGVDADDQVRLVVDNGAASEVTAHLRGDVT